MENFLSRRYDFIYVFSILAFLLVGCSAQTAPAAPLADLQWQQLNQGLTPHVPVAAIAFDPHHAEQMAVAVYDPLGLYTSADGGQSWRADERLGQPLHALIYDRYQPGVLWAGSADGLYRGRLAGGHWSWQRATDWPLARAAFSVIQSEEGVRYAGGQGAFEQPPAVWRSQNGERWQPLSPLPAPPGSAVLSVAVAGEQLLAGTDGFGLFTSRDGGQNWMQAAEIGETYVAALWPAPWNPDLILARTRNGLYRSADGAASWQPVGEALGGRPDAIAAAPGGPIYLGMSTGEILRSEDSGATWQPWSALERDGLFYTLAVDPDHPSLLYAGTHHGLYRSQDSGRSWKQIEAIGVFGATALAQDAGGVLYLGNAGGVYRSTDGGEQWQFRGYGLPLRTVQALGVAPGNPSLLFAGTDTGVYRSLDGGASWQVIGWADRGVHGLMLAPDDPNRLYVRLAFERIYSTAQALDPEPSWTAHWEGMPQASEILSMAVDPDDPTRLYAGATADFFVSDNRAESWRGLAPELRGQSVFVVVVDPVQPRRLYAGATNGLFHSEDRGEAWQWLGLRDITVTALAFHTERPDILYAGTKHQGIWRSGDGGRTWQAAGLSATTIHALLISPDGRWLSAASERGFWRVELE